MKQNENIILVEKDLIIRRSWQNVFYKRKLSMLFFLLRTVDCHFTFVNEAHVPIASKKWVRLVKVLMKSFYWCIYSYLQNDWRGCVCRNGKRETNFHQSLPSKGPITSHSNAKRKWSWWQLEGHGAGQLLFHCLKIYTEVLASCSAIYKNSKKKEMKDAVRNGQIGHYPDASEEMQVLPAAHLCQQGCDRARRDSQRGIW